MDFDSPDVEKDFPGLYASESGGSRKKEDEDFNGDLGGDNEKISKKDLLLGRRKDKKDKKDRGYATLDGESSPEEDLDTKSPSKSAKKSKAFKFPSKSKEKREKSRDKEKLDVIQPQQQQQQPPLQFQQQQQIQQPHQSAQHQHKEKDVIVVAEGKDKKKDKDKKDKDKEKKERTKEKDSKKDKKSKHSSTSASGGSGSGGAGGGSNTTVEEFMDLGEAQPIFGVSLGLAVERSRCHDLVNLPLVVRDCIDYLQENGLQSEHIYKMEAVKIRLQQIKKSYNNREIFDGDFDVPTACGVLKLYLKELPEPILTTDLSTRFEEAVNGSQSTQEEQQIQELHNLIQILPGCNRTLLAWITLHLDSIIKNEKYNKINGQTLATLLCNTLQMSHRLLLAILANSSILFSDIKLQKYVPPITSSSPNLPETPVEIQQELCKQESLLNQIHLEMNAGFVTKKREEQLWEVQRIITQLKRKFRMFEKKQDSMQKSVDDNIDNVESTQSITSPPPTSSLLAGDEHKTTTIAIVHYPDVNNVNVRSNSLNESIIMKSTEIIAPGQKKLETPLIVGEKITVVGDDDDGDNDENSIIPNDGLHYDESGLFLMLSSKSHPEYLNLIRLQLKYRELFKWKIELQQRLQRDNLEIQQLTNALTNRDETKNNINNTIDTNGNLENIPSQNDLILNDKKQKLNQNQNHNKLIIPNEQETYEWVISNYMKENALLEQKKQKLVREIVRENTKLIKLNVELMAGTQFS